MPTVTKIIPGFRIEEYLREVRRRELRIDNFELAYFEIGYVEVVRARESDPSEYEAFTVNSVEPARVTWEVLDAMTSVLTGE